MRVQKLYIFCLVSGDQQDDHEVIGGCDALFERSIPKCGSVMLCRSDGKQKEGQKIAQGGPPPERKVGAYLVCHAYGGVPSWGKDDLKGVISLMQKSMGKDFTNLQKLAVLACKSAPMLKKSMLKKTVLDSIEKVNAAEDLPRKDLLRLLLHLRKQGCSPMLAGYDCFVSVAFSGTKFEPEIETLNLQPGQKFIDNGKKGYRHAGGTGKARKHKRFFTLNKSGAVETVTHAGWSDK